MILIRVASTGLLLTYLVALAAVLSEYNPTIATNVVGSVSAWMLERGYPESISTPYRVEFVLNALMFSPLVFLASLSLPTHPWANWVAYAFIASGAVELWQGLVLPPRSAQMVDVVANTLGALLGSVLARPLAWALVRGSTQKV